jgi:hypothetical protein
VSVQHVRMQSTAAMVLCRFLLVDLPEIGSMKPTIFELIRPVFEEWIGNIPLVPSAIYGVRIYTEGSILQVCFT